MGSAREPVAPAYLPPRDRWHVWPTATAARRAFLEAIARAAPEVLTDLRSRTRDAAAAALAAGPAGVVRWWHNPETGDTHPEVIFTPEQEARMRQPSPVATAVEEWATRWRLRDGEAGWPRFILGVASETALAAAAGAAGGWTLPPDPLDATMPPELAATVRARRAAWVPIDAAAGADAAKRAAAEAARREAQRLEAAGWVRDEQPHGTKRYEWLAAWQCGGASYSAMTKRFGAPLATLRTGIPAAAASVGLTVRKGPAFR